MDHAGLRENVLVEKTERRLLHDKGTRAKAAGWRRVDRGCLNPPPRLRDGRIKTARDKSQRKHASVLQGLRNMRVCGYTV